MSLPAAVVLVVLYLAGIAMLWLGLRRVQDLLEFRRNSVLLSARQLPDNVKPQPFGGASLQASVYQRQGSFYCPLTNKKRIAIERVTSSRQSRWEEGKRIAVRVRKHPPHEALIATFRNLYLFPVVYLAVGAGLAVVLPLAILSARSSRMPAGPFRAVCEVERHGGTPEARSHLHGMPCRSTSGNEAPIRESDAGPRL